MRVHLIGKTFSATVLADMGEAYMVMQDDGVKAVWYKSECMPWLTEKEG